MLVPDRIAGVLERPRDPVRPGLVGLVEAHEEVALSVGGLGHPGYRWMRGDHSSPPASYYGCCFEQDSHLFAVVGASETVRFSAKKPDSVGTCRDGWKGPHRRAFQLSMLARGTRGTGLHSACFHPDDPASWVSRRPIFE